VRRIFEEYAAGTSARAIVHRLNAEGVPSPRGGTWAVSALVGDRKRGAGC
jgi:site-specific DNA recombinase